MTRFLVQIVAGLPPAIDGVGDYALALAHALRARQEIETLFVIANPAGRGLDGGSSGIIEGFPITVVARKSPASLPLAIEAILDGARAGPATPVLFHCSMYGYATRAMAFWLQKGLFKWKREAPQSALITMFHELVADGPIWTSAFWLHGTQCGLIRRFARASTASLTSNARYRRHLAQIAAIEESHIVRLPVLSTVGEPGELAPVRARKRQLVVFGKPHSRDLAFSRGLANLESVCRALGIERILEVGPDPGARGQPGLPGVEATGALAAGSVSAILQDSQFGFIASDASVLSKSSVFAAYCAHGTVPIVAGLDGGEADGLYADRQYLRTPLRGSLGEDQLDTVSESARTWYGAHGVAAQASRYAGILEAIRSDRISEAWQGLADNRPAAGRSDG